MSALAGRALAQKKFGERHSDAAPGPHWRAGLDTLHRRRASRPRGARRRRKGRSQARPRRARQRRFFLGQRLRVPRRLCRRVHGQSAQGAPGQSFSDDEKLRPRLQIRQGVPGDQPAALADRFPRPVAIPRDQLRQRPRLGIREGRAEVRPRSAEGGQGALHRFYRTQASAHPRQDAEQGLRLGHGADAGQPDGLFLQVVSAGGRAAVRGERRRRAGHEVPRRRPAASPRFPRRRKSRRKCASAGR